MGLTTLDTAHILLALLIMLAMTHAMGFLFQAIRQPVVIGEILAGILLGPTFIGYFFPEPSSMLMGEGTISKTVLSALGQLGLIFLMFSSGLEIRNIFQKKGNRTSLFVSSIGCLLPFAVGAIFVQAFDQSANYGTASNSTAFLIIFASSIAVTSIPVISRIFIDLGMMDSNFARTVVASAVIEDIALYVVMGVALGLVAQKAGDQSILANAMGLHLESSGLFVYHLVIHVGFLAFSLLAGPKIFKVMSESSWNAVARKNPTGFLLVTLFIITVLGCALGISVMFSSFCAGFIVASSGDRYEVETVAMKKNAFGLSIPIYFCMIGYKLNLIKDFHPFNFIVLLIFACIVKAASVYAAARLAKEPHRLSVHLAICMNARGGPGIVLASVAWQAKIINDSFFVSLVLLALVTSMGAGSWLERCLRRGERFA